MTLTRKQRRALEILERHPDACGCIAPCHPTDEDSYGGWINVRTAEALERRGLVEIDRGLDEWPIDLRSDGDREAA